MKTVVLMPGIAKLPSVNTPSKNQKACNDR